MARRITDPKRRAETYHALSAVYSRAGNGRAAHASIKTSIESLHTLDDPSGIERDYLLAAATARQAEFGDLSGALETIELLNSAGVRDFARSEVVAALLPRGEHDAAIDVAKSIEQTDVKDLSFSGIAEHIAAIGDVKHALELVESIVDDSSKEATFLLIALARVAANDIASAEPAIALIDSPAMKVRALCEIASAQLDACHRKAARQTYLEAKRIAEEAGLKMMPLIVVQAQLGDVRESLSAVDNITDPLQRDRVLKQIIVWLAESRRIPEALRILPTMASEVEQAQALREIALRRAITGDVAGALQTARRISMDAVRSEALRRVAAIQLTKCDCVGANATLAEAQKTAKSVDIGGGTNVSLLREIAVVQAESGNCDAAKQTFVMALEAASAYEDDYYRAHLLFEVAYAQSRSGFSDDASNWATKIALPINRAYALMGVADGIVARTACASTP